MELSITGQNVEILPTVQSYVEKKLKKINRHLPNAKTAKVELRELKARKTKFRFKAQVTIEADGLLLRAEENAENLLAAIDKVVPALDRQIERYKGKVYKKGKAGQSVKTAVREATPVESDSPALVRTKRFPIQYMRTEEAINQMELLGHDFYLFKNAVTKDLNLVYRRRDGNYSIIEQES